MIADPSAVRWLVTVLKDPEKRVRHAATESFLKLRIEAAMVLGELGDRRAVPVQLEALEDRNPEEVVLSAIRALGNIGDPGPLPRSSRSWMNASARLERPA